MYKKKLIFLAQKMKEMFKVILSERFRKATVGQAKKSFILSFFRSIYHLTVNIRIYQRNKPN
jgi:hypothetical protein